MQRILNAASFQIRSIFNSIISKNNNFIQASSYSKCCKSKKSKKRLCPKKKKKKCPLDNAEELLKNAPKPLHPFADHGWGLRQKSVCEERRIFKCEIAQCALGKKPCNISPPPCLSSKYVPAREGIDKNTVSGCPRTGWERFYKNQRK